jgi:hypothetical protein
MRTSLAGGLFLFIAIILAPSHHAAGEGLEGMLWPSGALTKVLRSDSPEVGIERVIHVTAARAEIASTQAVFRSHTNHSSVSASITDLRHAAGDAVIPAAAIRLQWVRYIDVDRNTAGIPQDELQVEAPASIPDPFWEQPQIAVKADQAQPLWIEIHVPAAARAGSYQGTLTVTSENASVGIPLELHVWDFEVPRERHLSVINWWRFPGPGFEDTELYGEKYWDLLGRFCSFLVQHRQTDIQTSIGLIHETEDNRRGYSYDTSRLEHYAEVAFQAGIQQIHLHSVGRRTANLTDPDSRIEPVESNLRRLSAWEKIVGRQDWEGRFLVSISDEPFVHHEESYAAMVDRVHKAAPHIRCIEAVEAE